MNLVVNRVGSRRDRHTLKASYSIVILTIEFQTECEWIENEARVNHTVWSSYIPVIDQPWNAEYVVHNMMIIIMKRNINICTAVHVPQ